MVDRHWDDFESAQAAQLKINNGHHLTDNELRCAKARKERTVLQKKEVILDENVRRQHVHALQIRCGEAPDIGVAKLNKAAHRYRQKIVQPDAYDLPSLSLEHHFEGSRPSIVKPPKAKPKTIGKQKNSLPVMTATVKVVEHSLV